MIGILLIFLLASPPSSYAEDRCIEVSKLAVECYREKSRGVADRCRTLMTNRKEFRNLYDKACAYGCMSESLYEANMMAEVIKKECRESNALKEDAEGLK